MSATRVGFVGLGDMGGRIALRIARAGLPLVVHDARPAAAAALEDAGALFVDSCARVAERSDVIGVCVVDDAQVRQVVREMEMHLCKGKTVLVHSSVAPATMRELGAAIAGTGAAILDAPVSGSRPAADAGTLTVLVGGDGAVLERVRPVVDCFAKHVFHVGGLGAGEALKLANNVMLHMNHLIVLEALRFAVSQGIDEAAALEAINVSSGRSWVTETWGLIDDMLDDHPQAGTPEIYATMSKDMWQSVVAARASAVPMPLTALGTQVSEAYFREREAQLARIRTTQ
ncbi:MAG TPA: NAD(P)-dependent oxidoreductase [Sporichthyaceae bacterium]|nr:NAD(P)-dependent oxidoreductase [Sporichthyaceae bacterium]